MKKIDKSGLCLDEYSTNKNIANIYFKKTIGKLPKKEASKAYTSRKEKAKAGSEKRKEDTQKEKEKGT